MSAWRRRFQWERFLSSPGPVFNRSVRTPGAAAAPRGLDVADPEAARVGVAARAVARHRTTFGAEPDVVAVAPGRINIIGEHTDYAGGLCLPAAVDRYLAVAASRSAGIELSSEQEEGPPVTIDPDEVQPTGGWADHPLGVLSELGLLGMAVTIRLAVASDIPLGSGLSSSAALGVATAMSALKLAGVVMDAYEVARLCRRAENRFLGVPSGLMDQVASLLGREGCALLFDAGSETVELVQLPESLAWLVIPSGIERALRGGDYADRSAEAAEALRLARRHHPDLTSLCDLDVLGVEALGLPEPWNRRARHIASECVRVRMALACLEAENLEALGQLLVTSHRSLDRDYEVSLPELDRIVDVALRAGCAGARLMGAGFGGSVLAVVAAERVGKAVAAISKATPPSAAAVRRGGGGVYRVGVVDGAALAAPGG